MIATNDLHSSDEILIGWLHLMYHIQQPHLYLASRASRHGCRFCPRSA